MQDTLKLWLDFGENARRKREKNRDHCSIDFILSSFAPASFTISPSDFFLLAWPNMTNSLSFDYDFHLIFWMLL